MKNIKGIANTVRFAIASTADKNLWVHPIKAVDEARPDYTHYIGEVMAGEARGTPVKETFETLMGEFRDLGGSWPELCELFAALFFYAMAARLGAAACAEAYKCMGEVISALDEKFADDKPSWSRFIIAMADIQDFSFIKNAAKD